MQDPTAAQRLTRSALLGTLLGALLLAACSTRASDGRVGDPGPTATTQRAASATGEASQTASTTPTSVVDEEVSPVPSATTPVPTGVASPSAEPATQIPPPAGSPHAVTQTAPPTATPPAAPAVTSTASPLPTAQPVTIPIGSVGGRITCPLFPANNPWNQRVDQLPVHTNSQAYVASIGLESPVHPDFGSGVWPPEGGGPIGIPYVVVGAGQPSVSVSFGYSSESDPGPYPVPSNAPIEGGNNSNGDRHVLVLDDDRCMLYELFDAQPIDGGPWQAGSGAIFDLRSNALRPAGWTSADAAGLPILPGLVRYDEVAAGSITHAIRFTAPRTHRSYVWPARHFASSIVDPAYPPMGQRFRLRADFDTSGFAPPVRVILRAMQQYGLILADNGSPWFISGAPDERWNNEALRQLRQLRGGDFEAVDVSSLPGYAD